MSTYQELWSQHLDTSIDDALFPLLKDDLVWLPWLGKDYNNSKGRMLLVGESHYVNEKDPAKVAAKKAEYTNEPLSTRQIVAEYPLEGKDAGWERNNPTFDNLHRTLLGTSLCSPSEREKRGLLWNQFAFYNFVQRVMDYGAGIRPRERPSDKDFLEGWRTFVKVITLLQPSTCIFLGVQASNTFNQAMADMQIKCTAIHHGTLRNGVYTRYGGQVTVNGKTTTIVFMRHPSQYFNWKVWRLYFHEIMPDNMAHIRKTVLNEESPL